MFVVTHLHMNLLVARREWDLLTMDVGIVSVPREMARNFDKQSYQKDSGRTH